VLRKIHTSSFEANRMGNRSLHPQTIYTVDRMLVEQLEMM
jgi:hypothetical protein